MTARRTNSFIVLAFAFAAAVLAVLFVLPTPAHASTGYFMNRTRVIATAGNTVDLGIYKKGYAEAAAGSTKATDTIENVKIKPSKFVWTSSKTKVATVAANGTVTAKRAGMTIIKAKGKKKTYKCRLLVINPLDAKGSDADRPAYDPAKGNAIVTEAFSWIGKGKYRAGACRKGKFDCSGFVSWCIAKKRIGNTYSFLGHKRVSKPMPGDICVRSSHAGIYIGCGLMIHSANKRLGVRMDKVEKGMVYVRIYS